ncbi:phage major capsid protein [Rhodococcus zopfii]|uniref:Phage major capsid protein n=1 Tax=Rhodococcus zopfii TaxID=43772 RepID=A0ABU3WQI3_9NOCA|nr:phage major capsid protein [Rhodococcus zopfii]
MRRSWPTPRPYRPDSTGPPPSGRWTDWAVASPVSRGPRVVWAWQARPVRSWPSVWRRAWWTARRPSCRPAPLTRAFRSCRRSWSWATRPIPSWTLSWPSRPRDRRSRRWSSASATTTPPRWRRGETKPTSVFGLEEIEVNLEVLAHMSEPTPRYWFDDNDALQVFVEDEMVRGLRDSLEAQVLTGDGERPNLQGILTMSGIQVQAFTTDVARPVRAAITKLETAGHEDNHVIVLSPADWEAAETVRAEGSGQLEAVANVTQRAQRTLWGVPVVVSTALPGGDGPGPGPGGRRRLHGRRGGRAMERDRRGRLPEEPRPCPRGIAVRGGGVQAAGRGEGGHRRHAVAP